MKIALISGSPRRNQSASRTILNGVKEYVGSRAECTDITIARTAAEESVLGSLKDFDVLVLAFPLYVDGIPSHLLSMMEQIERGGFIAKNTPLYVVVNCGFYESEQCDLALEMAKHWCARCGAQWGGGLGFGGGGGLDMMEAVPMGYGPKKNLGRELKNIADSVAAGLCWEYRFASINFPAFLYKLGAHSNWAQRAKANGLKRKDLSRRL